ncbi:phosphotriesterase, partial [Streptomyces sp. NPDC005921]
PTLSQMALERLTPWVLRSNGITRSSVSEAGFGDRLLLGGDTVVAGARSVDGGPGLPYLLRRVRPRLVAELGTEQVDRILTANPARAFAVEGR